MTNYTQNIAVYIRTTTGDTEAVDRQRAEVSSYIAGLAKDGLGTNITEYIDSDTSGMNTDRPALNQLLNHAKSQQFDLIVTTDLARLSRDENKVSELMETLEGTGAVVDFTTSPELVVDTDEMDTQQMEHINYQASEAEEELSSND